MLRVKIARRIDLPGNPPASAALSFTNGARAMVKEVEVNDNAAQDHERQPQEPLQGKSLQINKNSVEDPQRSPSPAPPRRGASDKHNQQKLQGKSLQINTTTE
jgi:hypothetical protein